MDKKNQPCGWLSEPIIKMVSHSVTGKFVELKGCALGRSSVCFFSVSLFTCARLIRAARAKISGTSFHLENFIGISVFPSALLWIRTLRRGANVALFGRSVVLVSVKREFEP